MCEKAKRTETKARGALVARGDRRQEHPGEEKRRRRENDRVREERKEALEIGQGDGQGHWGL